MDNNQSQDGSAVNQETSSASENNQNTETKVIDPAEHKRAIDDMLKYKADNKALKSQLESLSTTVESLKKKGLQSTNDYKTLWEQTESKYVEKEKELNQTKESFLNTLKSAELKNHAIKAGILDSAIPDLDLIPLDEIETEFTTNGRVIINGADKTVERLKQTKKHWFRPSNAANLNTGGQGGGNHPVELTAAYMNELSKKNPAEYRRLMPSFAKQAVKRQQ